MANDSTSGRMPSVLDREVSNRESDAFGHQHFADGLRSLIESSGHSPPYSIGLLGGWGTGKSTIKRLYMETLADDTKRDGERRKRSERIRVVTFNAWRFGGEDIKRALLRHVFLELGGNRGDLRDALFHHIEEVEAKGRSSREILREIFDRWVFGLFQLLVPFALVIGLLILVLYLFPGLPPAAYGVVFASAMGALGYSLKQYFASARFFVSSTSPIKRIDLPQTSSEQFEDLLLDQMASFKSAHRACERIVIFVDDLDRLSAEEMVRGLDAVRTFLEIPESQMPKDLGVVFVISCDENRVAQAIAGKQRRFGGADLPGSVFNLSDARRFLDRIFQFRLEIPSFPQRDMRSFAEAKFRENAPEIVEDLESRAVAIENVIDRMIHLGVKSPRNAIQIVNAFIQSWWIANRREREGAGTEAVGGLSENAVTGHAITLAALSALRVDFPDFYADLQDDPSLIRRVEAIVFRGAAIEDEPSSTQPVLKKYLDTDGRDFREPYRPLRQFLASLGGMRWPDSLQAHLQLAQDPWTRRLGDRAHRLYEAFTSGDTRSVLSEFGRGHDDKLLQRDDCRKLRDLEGDLYRESSIRKNNAAFVLAELLPRIPTDDAPSLMTPLAKRLADSSDLRSRVGVSRMKGILRYASAGDRQHVAETLVGDFCRSDSDVEFSLETGEAPSLDEAIAAVKEAVSIALWVRGTDGLSESADEGLLSWLEVRRIEVGDRESALPFDVLEEWVGEFEESLLPGFASQYLDLLVAQFEAEDTESFDVDASIARTSRIFGQLQAAGEESRNVLRTHAPRFAAVRSADAVACVTAFLLEQHEQMDAEGLSKMVLALAARVGRSLTEPSEWELGDESAQEALVRIEDARGPDLSDEAQEALVGLAKAMGVRSETGVAAVGLARALSRHRAAGDLFGHWGDEIVNSLAIPCAVHIGSQFALELDEEDRQRVINALTVVIKADNITDDQRVRYRAFTGSLGSEGARTAEFQSHLTALLPVIAQRHGNPNDYLSSVYPALVQVISFCPSAALGDMLQKLLTQTRSSAEVFGLIHECMEGVWPKSTDETAGYNPDALFSQGIEFVNQQPQSAQAGAVLVSLSSMLKDGVVSEQDSTIVDVACQVWPSNRDAASRVFTSHGGTPPAAAIAALATGITHEDAEDWEHLRVVWEGFRDNLTISEQRDVAIAILQSEAISSDSSPDEIFELWMESLLEDTGPEVLAQVILSEEVSDSLTVRAWGQAERMAQALGLKFFCKVIPDLLGIEDAPDAHRAILDSKPSLTTIAGSADARHELSEALMKGLITSSSMEVKNRLAEWLRDLQAQAVTQNAGRYGDLTDDDVDALSNAFPELKRKLNKLRPGK